jgi:hypothetical protein
VTLTEGVRTCYEGTLINCPDVHSSYETYWREVELPHTWNALGASICWCY